MATPMVMDLPTITGIVEHVVGTNGNVMVHTRPGRGTITGLTKALESTGRTVHDLRLPFFTSPIDLEVESNSILLVSEFTDATLGKRILLKFLMEKPKDIAVVGVSLETNSNMPALDNRFIHLFRD